MPPPLTHPLAAGLSPSLHARSPLLPRLLLLAPPCPTHGLPGAELGELPPGNHQLLEALSSQNSDRKRGGEGWSQTEQCYSCRDIIDRRVQNLVQKPQVLLSITPECHIPLQRGRLLRQPGAICCSLRRAIEQTQHQWWLKHSLTKHESNHESRRGSLVGQGMQGECSERVEKARLLQAQHRSQATASLDSKRFPSGAASLLHICNFSCCCNINSNDYG